MTKTKDKKQRPGFINIAALRDRIRKYAERAAREAGLDNPYASVRIGDPQPSGRRNIGVEITHDTTSSTRDEAN